LNWDIDSDYITIAEDRRVFDFEPLTATGARQECLTDVGELGSNAFAGRVANPRPIANRPILWELATAAQLGKLSS
jgi:hypothetical protein